MTAVRIMLPDAVREKAAEAAHRQHMSFNRLIKIAIVRELARLPDSQLERRAARGRLADFEKVLAQVPDVPPEDYDKLQ